MKRLSIFLNAILLIASLAPIKASAINTQDYQSVVNNTVYYDDANDTASCLNTAAPGAATSAVALPSDATVEQKIAQTFIVGFDASTPQSVITDVVTKFHLGGIYLTGTHDAGAAGFNKAYFNSLSAAAGVPVTVASDEEGGQIQNFQYTSSFPSARDMGSMPDASVEAIGKMVGTTLTSAGVTENLAPVLDLDSGNASTSGGNKNVIAGYGRAFSSSPATVTAKASAFAKGLTAAGIGVTFKHFPGLGYATGSLGNDSDHAVVTSPAIATLKSRDLLPYQSLIASYPNATVMLSNENVTGLDAAEPASVSPAVVNLLRNDYKFTGTITSDDLNVTSVTSQVGSINAAVIKALNAGVQRPLFGEIGKDSTTAEASLTSIIAAVKAGVQLTTIDAAVAKVLAAKGGAAVSAGGVTPQAGGSSTLDGFKLPATTGQTGVEEPVNLQGQVPSTGAPVSFPQFAKLGQNYRDYYINMRWTFASWDWGGHSKMVDQKQYDWMNGSKPKLVLVTNAKTGKSIIADIMETGPGPSVGSTWRASHGNSSAVAPPYWQGFQTGTPTGYDGMVAGMPPTALAALGMNRATDIDPSYAKGGVTTPLTFNWAPDQTAAPGPTTAVAAGGTDRTNPSGCCATITDGAGTSITLTGASNAEKVMAFLMDKTNGPGFTLAGAAGALGNLIQESGVASTSGVKVSSGAIMDIKPNVQEKDDGSGQHAWPKGGWGIAQWTAGRRPGLVDAITKAGLFRLYTDDETKKLDLAQADNDALMKVELSYLMTELKSSYPKTLSDGQSATAASDAAFQWEDTYEGCTPTYTEEQCGVPTRRKDATAIYNQFLSKADASAPTTPSTPATPAAPAADSVPAASTCDGITTTPGDSVGTGFNGLLTSYAWGTYIRSADGGTKQKPAYTAAVKKAKDAGQYTGDTGVTGDGYPYGGDDCSTFSWLLMVNSGYDPSFAKGYTVDQFEYLTKNWQVIGKTGSVDASQLKPGDVAVSPGEHVFLFIGNVPGFSNQFASASSGTEGLELRAPMSSSFENASYGPGRFTWFRKK